MVTMVNSKICLQFFFWIQFFSFGSFATDTKNDNIYKNLAKKLCSIEYSYFLERDRIKEAAKQSTVDGFDEVINQNIIQAIVISI